MSIYITIYIPQYIVFIRFSSSLFKIRYVIFIRKQRGLNNSKKSKNLFRMHRFQKELGSDNGKELHNKLIENYLNEKNIIFLHGMPYNPHSQVVERFHKTVKDSLYCIYLDNPEEFDIKENLDIIIKKYNNQFHLQQNILLINFFNQKMIIYLKSIKNIKNSFKSRGSIEQNYQENDKCLLNKKFKIKKYYN